MQQIRSIEEAEKILGTYVPPATDLHKNYHLERMQPLLDLLNNPQDRLKVIHIAGTSGKTSTSYYIAALLKAAGVSTGLTVSPHVDSTAERLQINLTPLPGEQFAGALSEFLEIIKNVEPRPSYFELIVAWAYWYFAKQHVDYAVIETGLGGLNDCSNVARREDKVCVITDIGYDHMNILGTTLPAIASQKAGIIHAGNHAFMLQQPDEVVKVMEARIREVGATLDIVAQEHEAKKFKDTTAFKELPLYQQRNWLLAHLAYEYVRERDNLPQLSLKQLAETMQVKVPGRMDTMQVAGKTVIMDGAHNEQKMTAFVRSFQARYPGQKAAVLLGMKEGKEYLAVLNVLQPITSRLVLTTFDISQDLPAMPLSPDMLKAEAEKLGYTDVIAEADQRKAWQLLKDSPQHLLIVTGSFYLLGQLRGSGIQ